MLVDSGSWLYYSLVLGTVEFCFATDFFIFYMWYRCNFSKQVLFWGERSPIFVGGKPETTMRSIGTFVLFS